MSGEEAEFLDSGVCRDMKAPVGDRDTCRGGNAFLMSVIRTTGHHWRPGRKDQPAVDSKLPDCREQTDLPPSQGLAANIDSYCLGFFSSFSVVLGSSLLCGLFSSCSVWASPCGGFSCCGAQALGHLGSGSCSQRMRWWDGITDSMDMSW